MGSDFIAELEQDGDVTYETIDSELLSTIYKCDPSLDDDTGRLVPGKRSSEIALRLHLTDPDTDGVSHLGGMRGESSLLNEVIEDLKSKGYTIKR